MHIKSTSIWVVIGLAFICLASDTALSQGRNRSGGRPTTPPQSSNPTTDAQRNSPQKQHRVIVNLKNGDPVTGNFIQANADAIQIEVAGNRLNIKLDDIANLIFSPEAAKKSSSEEIARPVPSQSNELASSAIRALRKLAGATEVGISFREYGSRVIDVKADVDESIRELPEGDLRNEIRLAMEAYADAAQAWNEMTRHEFMLINYEHGASLQKKYSIPVDTSLSSPIMRRDVVLSVIWKAARTHIDRASSLMTGEALPPTPTNAAPVNQSPTSPEVAATVTPNSIVGKWTLLIVAANNQSETWTFNVNQESGKLSGTIQSRSGLLQINDIHAQGNTFNFNASDVINGQPVVVTVSGHTENNSMKGSIVITVQSGASVSLPFTGTRIKQ